MDQKKLVSYPGDELTVKVDDFPVFNGGRSGG
jgi:hypothetical protein